MNKAPDVLLCSEELSFAVSLLGRPNLSKEILQNSYGAMQENDIRSRLISASHALFARGLVFGAKQSAPELSSDLKSILGIFCNHRCVVRMGRHDQHATRIDSYYVSAKSIVQHVAKDRFMHEFRKVSKLEAIANNATQLFSPSFGKDGKHAAAVGVPDNCIAAISEFSTESINETADLLIRLGPTEALLAADLRQAIWTGTTYFLGQTEPSSVSGMGSLWLQAPERLWQFSRFPRIEGGGLGAKNCLRREFEDHVSGLVESSRLARKVQ